MWLYGCASLPMITDRVDHVNRSVNCLLTLRVDSDHVKRSVNCFLTLLVDSRHGELVAKSRAHNNRNNRIKVRGNVINCHPCGACEDNLYKCRRPSNRRPSLSLCNSCGVLIEMPTQTT